MPKPDAPSVRLKQTSANEPINLLGIPLIVFAATHPQLLTFSHI